MFTVIPETLHYFILEIESTMPCICAYEVGGGKKQFLCQVSEFVVGKSGHTVLILDMLG